MAEASYNLKPSNSKHTNWIKACLAVLITKEGIEPFVYDEIKQFQQKCLTDICYNNWIPSGTVCTSCCTENVVVCPTNRICNVGRGRCSYHKNSTKEYQPAGCPKKICHNLRTDIQKAHRYYGPSYKNTDATQWCTNPWEVAKCFMPPDGYKDVTSPAETDFNGLINVILNCKDFQAKINDDLGKKSNIFEKGRRIDEAVRHSPSLEVEDVDLQQYFTDLQDILSDPKYIAGNRDAVNAKNKFSQLQNDTLVVDVKKFSQMLEDVAADVRRDIKEGKDDLKKKSDEQKLELITAMTEAIDRTGESSLFETEQIKENLISKDKFEAEFGMETMETKSKNAVKEGAENLKKETYVGVKEKTSFTEKSNKQREEKNTTIDEHEKGKNNNSKKETGEPVAEKPKLQKAEQDEYQQMIKQLKEDLINLYRQQYHTLPLSPLFEEYDTPLLGFYVMPDINKVAIQRSIDGSKEIKSKLTTLREMFYNENHVYRNIYLVADAGLGKTAFSKWLALTWCQAHKNIKRDTEHFKKPEINAMSQFEFVFLLYLRECSDECDIDYMIRKQIIPLLTNTPENIETVLSKEKCLVIMDGLDDWAHPASPCTLRPRDIPHRKARENCTFLTTARSWKLSVINLKQSEIDHKLELEGLSEKSRDTIKKNVISQYMPGATKEQVMKQLRAFNSAVADKGISDKETIPLLLMYLMCVWCDTKDLGQSKCEIYCQIVELHLKRALSKYPECHSKFPSSQSNIPACFNYYENCQSHFTFLTSLGELAFKTLYSKTSENRLVFDSYIAENYLKEDFLELGRLTGIITQDKQSRLMSQIRKTSFSHKTVQEYFAALYISTCLDQEEVLTEVLSFCNSTQDFLDLSEVFIFISGMNAELFSLIATKLMEVINKDEITSEYRSAVEHGYMVPLEYTRIQDMFVSCVTEIPDNENVNFCLQDLFFDKKCKQEQKNYYTSLQRLAVNNQTNITSIYIDNKIVQRVSETIDSCELSDRQIHCQKFHSDCEWHEEEIVRVLSTSVKYLSMEGIERDDERRDERSFLTDEQCKIFHSSSQLETIQIWYSAVSHEFLNYIINVKSKKEITLFSLTCGDHGDSCPGFNFDLSQHSGLSKLVIWGNFTLCDMNEDESSLLHNMRNIADVDLYDVKMSSGLLRRLVDVLIELDHPACVEIFDCKITPEADYEDILNYIRESEHFVVKLDSKYWNKFEFETKGKLRD